MLLFNGIGIPINPADSNFNTSNVTIQLTNPEGFTATPYNFNTSNVTIQQAGKIYRMRLVYHFNTSNVTIQRKMLTHKITPH